MAGSNSGTRSRPQSFLSRIPASEFKLIRVAVKRTLNNNTTTSTGPIERSIDDPKQIIPLIHIRKDEERRPRNIFDREDILVNPEECFVSTENGPHTSTTYSRSRSGTPRRRNRSRSRSRSADRDRHQIPQRERPRDRDVERDRNKSRRSSDKERGRDRERSLERDREKRQYRSRPHSKDREEERSRRRSRTPLRPGEYRPSHSDARCRSASRERDLARDKYRTHSRRSRSLSVDYHKPSTSKKPSRSPRRSATPSRDRLKSPRYETSQSRRSRSPIKEKSHYSDKRGREPSPGYRDSSKRRSRSPSRYERDRRRSRSPRYVESNKSKSSPGRYERYPPRRYSRSPVRHEGHRSSPDKRCRSPHPPIVTFSRSSHRRSRSPGYERYHKYRRSRSRSPRKHRSRSPHLEREAEFAFYEGIPGSEYWIPGPIRPGFPTIPRYYPPAFFPRMPGAPIILPPRIPMVAPYPPPYRQRLPVYNSKQVPKVTTSGPSGDGTVSTTGGGEPVPETSRSEVAVPEVSIQEVSDLESHKSERKVQEEETGDSRHEKD